MAATNNPITLIEAITQAVAQGDTVTLVGFG